MRRQEDSRYLEAALRASLARQPAPKSLKPQVMARVRAESRREGVRTAPARPFRRLAAWKSWALGTSAVAAAAALLLAVLPLRDTRTDAEAAAMESAGLELAEVLHMAGSEWNRAQQAALSPIQENGND